LRVFSPKLPSISPGVRVRWFTCEKWATDWEALRMDKAPFLVMALLLVPWPASGAMPDVTRWAAPEKMAQPVRARRAARRQRRGSHGAVEAGQLESARSKKEGETPKQRTPTPHRPPREDPEVPPAKERAAQEKWPPPRPLSKLSPALPAAPSV